ncbi:hypothetical protein GWN49_08350, partial [Candidatus Bathyarchaeota archaeon]|nr:hypothetical protein [Candidatus Bathyarchaeota archaeon]
DVDVCGSFKAKGKVDAEKIGVCGSVSLESEVDVEKLEVGGAAKVGGGKIRQIEVGGSFRSEGPLEFRNLDVGG